MDGDHSRIPVVRFATLGLALLILGGCSVYDRAYAFDPPVATVSTDAVSAESDASGDEGAATHDKDAIRTMVSVTGIRRADTRAGLPPSVEVRLHVINDSSQPVELDPDSLTLISANLQELPKPIVRAQRDFTIPAGERRGFAAYFPLDDPSRPRPRPRNEPPDLSGVSVNWLLRVDGNPVRNETSFSRRPVYRSYAYSYPYSYDPWWYPYDSYYYGYPYYRHYGYPYYRSYGYPYSYGYWRSYPYRSYGYCGPYIGFGVHYGRRYW
jgi:hypothetical protein